MLSSQLAFAPAPGIPAAWLVGAPPDRKASLLWLGKLAKDGRGGDALVALRWLQGRSCNPDVIHFGSVASACSRDGQWSLALLVLDLAVEGRVESNSVVFNSLVSTFGRGSEWTRSLALVVNIAEEGIEADAVALGAAVSACGRSGRWAGAVGLLEGAPTEQVSAVAYTAAIKACERQSQWPIALGLVDAMGARTLELDLFARNAAISAFAKGRQLGDALALLDAAQASSAKLDVVSYGAAIGACEAGAKWSKALGLLRQMVAANIEANTVTHGAAISSCARSGRWSEAVGLLHGSTPWDTISCNSAVSACERGGNWIMALELLCTSVRNKIRVGAAAYNQAVSACGKEGEWATALELMRGVQDLRLAPDSILFSAAIGACGLALRWEHALCLYEDLCAVDPMPHGICLGSVLSACGSAAAWGVATALLARELARWRAREGHAEFMRQVRAADFLDASADARLLLVRPGVVALAKPPGLTSERVLQQLEAKLRAAGHDTAITHVSRLDAPTSGVLVAALGGPSSFAAHCLLSQFAGRRVAKAYMCLCVGPPLGPVGSAVELTSPLESQEYAGDFHCSVPSQCGKPSRTYAEVLASFIAGQPRGIGKSGLARSYILMAVRPATGRKHQIRAHLASVGRPLVCDALYSSEAFSAESEWCPRLFLHCRRVALRDREGDVFAPEAPLPADLVAVLRRLQRDGDVGLLSGAMKMRTSQLQSDNQVVFGVV